MAGSPSSSRGGTLQTVRVHATAAEIIAMDTTAKLVVAAPAAGTLLLPQTAVMTYRAGSVAYDYDPELRVTWSGFQTAYLGRMIDTINHLTDFTDIFILQAFGFDTDDPDPTLSPLGQALVLTAPGVEFTPPFGNGTIDVAVTYLSVTP